MLAEHSWPTKDRDDLVTAVSEACTNAVLHAYPAEGEGDFAVAARIEAIGVHRHVRLWVRDWGRWQPQLDDGQHHMGLALIRHLVDRLDVQTLANGTELSVISGPVPRTGGL